MSSKDLKDLHYPAQGSYRTLSIGMSGAGTLLPAHGCSWGRSAPPSGTPPGPPGQTCTGSAHLGSYAGHWCLTPPAASSPTPSGTLHTQPAVKEVKERDFFLGFTWLATSNSLHCEIFGIFAVFWKGKRPPRRVKRLISSLRPIEKVLVGHPCIVFVV